ncbi:non-ribosomal peptide synthetase [Vallitalea maricola]|uniref:Uncharacterized protein n=1 Tax=Vallitalea maricola TaxID=3074433 RepID=A0ACB5UMF5_9FIRM|nr:hypothetical protein AN2V17_30370 [Vallitalea sp. AN17-2]
MNNLYPPLRRRKQDNNIYPLSFGQKRLWLINQLNIEGTEYNLLKGTIIKGKIDISILKRSIEIIINRHDILRTIFSNYGEEVRQHVLPAIKLPLTIIYNQGTSIEAHSTLDNIIEEERQHVFDLSQGPLFNMHFIQMQEKEYVFLFNIHHIVSDAWSIQLFLKEVLEVYLILIKGRNIEESENRLQYGDYTLWQHECYEMGLYNKDIDYWYKQLEHIPLLEMPYESSKSSNNSHQITYTFEKEIIDKMTSLCKKKKVTSFIFLLTCFNILIKGYTSQEDIAIASPVLGRQEYEMESMMGFFTNTVILRNKITSGMSFYQLLNQVAATVLDAYDYQKVDLGLIMNSLSKEQSKSVNSILQIFFSYYHRQLENIHIGQLSLESMDIDVKTSKFPFSVEIEEYNGNLDMHIAYNEDTFTMTTVDNMAKQYKHIIEQIVDNPDTNIDEISLLNQVEIEEIIEKWNDTYTPIDENKMIYELFEDRVKDDGTKIAVIQGDKKLNYRDLNNQSNKIASFLTNQGTKNEEPIIVCLESNINLIAVLIGILKAGCCYVPLDPELPFNRMNKIIEDVSPRFIVTSKEQYNIFSDIQSASVITVDEMNKNNGFKYLNRSKVSSDLAYIMYTSGTTGQPKGVEITHQSVVNFIYSMSHEPGIHREDVLLAVTSYGFDISVLEMFLPLVNGACLIMTSREEARDGYELKKIMDKYKPTIMQGTPATWRLLINSQWTGDKKRLKILCGGEILDKKLAMALCHRGKEVWNMYGPTETTIWSMIYRVKGYEDMIPIGKPIANTRIYILDEQLNPVPVGAIGNIYISGKGVAKGYRNKLQQSQKLFIPDKFVNGFRMYNTGDKGKYSEDGVIYYCGRTDSQFKIRGHRIEAREIEHTVLKYNGISCCIIAEYMDMAGEKNLALYMELEHDKHISLESLQNYLRQHLPYYMLPSYYTIMDKLPVTTNGKIDRKSLPQPQKRMLNEGDIYQAPTNDYEKKLVQIWEDVLKVQPISVKDNFFALGGHSLLGSIILTHINKAYDCTITLKDIFENPTIAQLAEVIVKEQMSQLGDSEFEELINEMN